MVRKLIFALFVGWLPVACGGDDAPGGTGPNGGNATVTGTVVDQRGLPVEGVVVSDGLLTTLTDESGYYALESDLSKRRFVQVTIPAAYEIPVKNGIPQFWRRIPEGATEFEADFTLQARRKAASRYTVLMTADPQIRSRSARYDNFAFHSIDMYEVLCRDLRETAASITDRPVYGISLGDLVHNDMSLYPTYCAGIADFDFPVFSVIGNHDHVQNAATDREAVKKFEEYLGPTCYSANIGDMHYVFVDNILYGRDDATKSYELGLSDEIAHWLRQDLSYVPKDKTIMICAHSQMFKKHSSFSTRNKNYPVYRDELLKFKNVYSWAGHNHHTYIYNYNRSEQMKIDNLTAVTVTRSTGSLRLNKHLNNDGTPQGYMIVDVDGGDVSWYYHSCGKDRNHQMRLYSPVRTGSDYVLANVWTWDDAWGPVEWWVDGVKVGEMEPCEEFDPDYVDLYATVTNKTTRKYCQPAKSFHMFRIRPEPGVKAGEVRVTDRFGTTYVERVSW